MAQVNPPRTGLYLYGVLLGTNLFPGFLLLSLFEASLGGGTRIDPIVKLLFAPFAGLLVSDLFHSWIALLLQWLCRVDSNRFVRYLRLLAPYQASRAVPGGADPELFHEARAAIGMMTLWSAGGTMGLVLLLFTLMSPAGLTAVVLGAPILLAVKKIVIGDDWREPRQYSFFLYLFFSLVLLVLLFQFRYDPRLTVLINGTGNRFTVPYQGVLVAGTALFFTGTVYYLEWLGRLRELLVEPKASDKKEGGR